MRKRYICTVCQYIYDPTPGDPNADTEAGTAFEDIPEDWVCSDSAVTKNDFVVLEET
ncbi:MAG: rubredoxin [Sulfurovum sp.]|nr:rubredoxin [Sulfurovum sp.]